MSTSLMMRALLAATALCVAPAIASAQAPQKRCGDGSTSTRSYFACWGHGGVDTSHAVERPRAEAPKHHEAEVAQAGRPRSKHAKPTTHAKSTAHPKSTTHAKSKASDHHARSEHHTAPAAKKKESDGHRGWLPWRHKKADEQKAKKPAKATKHARSSRLPVPERPNGQP